MTRFYNYFLDYVLEAGGKKRKITQQMYNELRKIPKNDFAFFDLSYNDPNKILEEFDLEIPQSKLKEFQNYLNKIKYGTEIEGCFKNKFDFELFDYTGDMSIDCTSEQKALEYVSTKLNYMDFKQDWPKIVKVINKNSGCLNQSCGGHVHMSLPLSLINNIYPGVDSDSDSDSDSDLDYDEYSYKKTQKF